MASNSISSLITDENKQEYQPKTLKERNNGRYAYLPLYPTVAFGPNNHLLLANVPVTHLAPNEIVRRHTGAYTSDAQMLMNNYHYSKEGFSLSEEDVEELAGRLQVGKSIITFNATRLGSICDSLLESHETFRREVLLKKDVALKEPTLNSKQMAIALEFYLQMDVDVFYMKTCSFRGAKPRSHSEGLFCGKDEPQANYTMVPCGSPFCPCCHPSNILEKSQPWPVIDFISSSMHQFVNGYTTYLNAPATCHTSNVIYTMTCPCGHYDYVDSTALTLVTAMAYHRHHGNRIIHEKLTGNSLFPEISYKPNEKQNTMTNKMRLYRHSARCPVALRSFLDCNPNYWCFIPMLWHDAQEENMACLRGLSSDADTVLTNVIIAGTVSNHKVTNCLDRVPLTPAAYAFSHRQRQKQRFFFEQLLSSNVDQLPYAALDLYQVAIIAVLPDDHSIILRYIIETLFIIHGETKLNMICPLGGDPEQRYGRPYDLVWCADLNRRLASTTASTH